MWRHSYKYRSEIGKILEKLRSSDMISGKKSSDAFAPGFECTAVHIRRGDRTLENENMIEYCARYRPTDDQATTNRTYMCTIHAYPSADFHI